MPPRCIHVLQRVDSQQVLRVAWLVLPWGALVTTAVCGTVLYSHARGSTQRGGGDAEVEGYAQAVVLHGEGSPPPR